MKKDPDLGSIAADVAVCQRCPLGRVRTMAVPGEGPQSARVMVVGEAPGRQEDLVGRPFVGRAGRLLDSTLGSVGAARGRVYITNVVKCRPPGNRLPRGNEIDACVGAHLSRELDAIRPKVTVLLGRTAAKALLGADSLREVRGRPVRRNGTVYVCTYHPAAVLRNPGRKRTFVRDLRLASELGRG